MELSLITETNQHLARVLQVRTATPPFSDSRAILRLISTECQRLPLQPHLICSIGTPALNSILTKKPKVTAELSQMPQLLHPPTLIASRLSIRLTTEADQQSVSHAPSLAQDSRCLLIGQRRTRTASAATLHKTTCSGSTSPFIRVTCRQVHRPVANLKATILVA